MEWSRTKTLSLISSIRLRPALWNTKSVDYMNKDLKNKLWDELGVKFCCSRYQIEKKLACLRSQHSRELLNMRRKRKQGINHESKWFAFNAMEMLRTRSNQTESNDVTVEEFTAKEEPDNDTVPTNDPLQLSDDSNDETTFYDPFNLSITQNQNNNEQFDGNQWKNERINGVEQRSNQSQDCDKVSEPEDVTNRESARQDNVPKTNLVIDQQLLLNDDLLAFGINVAAQLRNIKNSYSRSAAKLYIQKILFQAETGKI